MKSVNTEKLLYGLAELSQILADSNDEEAYADTMLSKICAMMDFDLGILYEVTNVVDGYLLLKVFKVYDPRRIRADVPQGNACEVDLNNPDQAYINEASAYGLKGISGVSVPGVGSDLVGFVHIPEKLGKGYLLSCDYVTKSRKILPHDTAAFSVVCNMLGSLIMREYSRRLATYDALTGVLNRGAIQEKMERAYKIRQRHSELTASLIMTDIDYFKQVNDSYGHLQGDLVLHEFASLIANNLRNGIDLVGRFGGEEFLVLLDHTTLQAAITFAERIRQKLEAYRFQLIGQDSRSIANRHISVTASFGISSIDKKRRPSSSSEWINQADVALYKAKNSGRNRVVAYTDANCSIHADGEKRRLSDSDSEYDNNE